jgi:hypothetical protein
MCGSNCTFEVVFGLKIIRGLSGSGVSLLEIQGSSKAVGRVSSWGAILICQDKKSEDKTSFGLLGIYMGQTPIIHYDLLVPQRNTI